MTWIIVPHQLEAGSQVGPGGSRWVLEASRDLVAHQLEAGSLHTVGTKGSGAP